MSDEKQTENKKKPNFYIFEKPKEGNGPLAGSIFCHMKGNGMDIIIDGKRYVAYPPKTESVNEAVPT